MTARAHVAIRIAAILWIATMALMPRASTPKPAAATQAAPAPAHVHAPVPNSRGPVLATR
jgi:hypothetical protein